MVRYDRYATECKGDSMSHGRGGRREIDIDMTPGMYGFIKCEMPTQPSQMNEQTLAVPVLGLGLQIDDQNTNDILTLTQPEDRQST